MRGVRAQFTDGSSQPTVRTRRITAGPKLLIGVVTTTALTVVVVSGLIPDPSPAEQPGAAAAEGPSGSDRPSPDPADRAESADRHQGSIAELAGLSPDTAKEVDRSTRKAAAQATAEFVKAWLLRDDSKARKKALKPVTAPPLLSTLANVDLARIPDASRKSWPDLVAAGPHQMIFRVRLSDDTSVDVTVVDDGDGDWRATDVRPTG